MDKKELEEAGHDRYGHEVYDTISQIEEVQNVANEFYENSEVQSYEFYDGEFKK